ncbi:MAG: NAD(P)/FAD-dependent oxidoreductase [Gammaproteobacteria bacterium]|nr:NAD(P)/FAD-dependent oxidoreductase [Gammaproteobacteria bacterium]
MENTHFDIIVIGAGHNGLTTANYLAMKGLNVCILEQRHIVGGAAVSEEFHPGYRNSIASYVVSLLRPEVISDLELKNYGYQTLPLDYGFYPGLDGEYLLIGNDEEENRCQFRKFSETDYDSYEELHEIIDKVGDVVSRQWLKAPTKLSESGLTDLIQAVKIGLDFYKLDDETRYRFLQLFIGAPETMIERWFESDKVKAMMAQHCLPANYTSLHHPGSSMAMLHHAVGGIDGVKGAWGLVKGGMGSITQAMAKSAEAKGVTIKTECTVGKILIENNCVQGVELNNGKKYFAKIIAANTEPKTTFLKFVGKEHLPDSFAKDIAVIRQESASLRMNLALNGLPQFACIPSKGIGPHHKSTISIIEDKDHVERAYRSARAGIPANPPLIEALIPSVVDDSLTDEPGHHVMSLLCKYMPYDLADGKQWDEEKDKVVEDILAYLSKYIPNLPDILVSWTCMTPLDLERIFGLPRGDICQGRLEPDQLFSTRPHPDAAQYATPVNGLYLCGSGSHPGGGVTGAPGHNAAKRILKDL